MALPHPLVAVAAVGLVGAGSLLATLQQDHGIPERAAQVYLSAARSASCPLDYRILAAIGAIESGHGTHGGAHIDDDGKINQPIGSYAGAQGPMQFMPSTWAAYGVDGDGDGQADIDDIDDAAPAAAAYLCANGAGADVDGALWNYNHDWSYVAQVKERAAALPPDDGSAAGQQSASQAVAPPEDKGRICGVGEWLAAGNDCVGDARSKAEYLWAQLGDTLDQEDTRRVHAIWSELNGKPPAPAAPAQPPPPPGLKGDLSDLPGSAGLQPDFAADLAALVSYAPGTITINQGYRSPEDALGKWQDALAKYGNEDDARQWVAKTVEVDGVIQCGSNHCKGLAADLSFADGQVEAWAHNHAADYGLTFPLGNEAWHVEPAGIRP